mgnify:FL=1
MNFIDLDGYGQFIWAAYGLTAFVLIGIAAQSLRFQARTDAELAALQGTLEAANGESAGRETQA